jgi:ketosteroid isomerase-like protein
VAEAQEQLLAPILERWERGDFSGWDERFAPDLVLSGFNADGVFWGRGPEEISKNLRQFFRQFRDYRIEPGEFDRIADDVLLMEGRQFATGRLSGVEVSETLYIAFRFDGDRLTEMHWHPSREGALEAAGISAK